MKYLLLNIKTLPEINTVCSFSCERGYSTGNMIASSDSIELTLVSEGKWKVSMLDGKFEVPPAYLKVYPPMVKRFALAVGEGVHRHTSIYMYPPDDIKILNEEEFVKRARVYREQHAFNPMDYCVFLPLVSNSAENLGMAQDFSNIIRLHASDQLYSRHRASILLLQMLTAISERSISNIDATDANEQIRSSVVQKMLVYINRNYKQLNGVAQIAENLRYNSSYLSTVFRNETGINTIDYINRLKVEEVKALIESDKYTFAQIAEMVGFKNVYYLYRVFKRYTGMTMGEYSKLFY